MAGKIKVNFSELEAIIKEISTQYNVLSDMQPRLSNIMWEVSEKWEDPAFDQFEAAYDEMLEEAIPQALVLLDTMQTLFETVCTTYQETDQTISGMIG